MFVFEIAFVNVSTGIIERERERERGEGGGGTKRVRISGEGVKERGRLTCEPN